MVRSTGLPKLGEVVLLLFTPLENPFYGPDDKNKASIPCRKDGVKAPFLLTGFSFNETFRELYGREPPE